MYYYENKRRKKSEIQMFFLSTRGNEKEWKTYIFFDRIKNTKKVKREILQKINN